MIKISELSKSYGNQVLFSDLSFNINPKEKIGIVGRNGFGKTTIFQMILGQTQQDSGTISIPKHYKVAHLEQHIGFTEDSVLKEGCTGLDESENNASWKVEKILFGLGFSKDDFHKHPSTFSGGYQIRLKLAKVLVSNPNLLMLDEPNNYLDIVAIRWLTSFLKSWNNELMLITHDRHFMDSINTHTMIIHRQKVRKIKGTTEKLYNQIAQEEEIYEKTRMNDEKKIKQTELFINRFRAKARLGGMVQSRIKSLEKQEKKAQLEKIDDLDFSFSAEVFPAAQMMALHNITFSYDKNIAPIIKDFSLNIGKKDRICVIGRNGKGKSTLLRIMAGEIRQDNGNLKNHPLLKTGYFGQTNVNKLNDNSTIIDEIMNSSTNCLPQKARDISGSLMFSGDSALKKISVLSGGEKSRVLLGKLLAAPSHLLLLDEPTNHLDMESCDSLVEAINAFEGSVIMVTHNEMYLHRLAERLIIFDNEQITLFEGTYQRFLEDIGWTGEEKSAEDSSNSQIANERKSSKRAKAELIQEKSRALKPLEKEIENLEKQITSMESEFKKNEELLIAASEKGDAKAIAELSKKNFSLKPQIDNSYDKLDKLTCDYENKSEEFSEKLQNFESSSEQ